MMITVSVINAADARIIQETNYNARVEILNNIRTEVVENIVAILNAQIRISEEPYVHLDIKNSMLRNLPSEYALDAMKTIETIYENAGYEVMMSEYSTATKKTKKKSFYISLYYGKDV